jgi:NitT/TauT family transport system substrate-binding protein
MFTKRDFLGAVAGVVAAPLVHVRQASAQTTTINLRLDWTFYGTHAPFFLASETGLYRAEGLNVVIGEGSGSGTTARLLAQGQDQIAFLDFGTMVKGIGGGMPIKAIFGVHQRSPMIIISMADAPVRSPKELEGKVIAMAPAESTAQMFPVLLSASGADASKISVLSPAVGAKTALLLQRRADAITGVNYFQIPAMEAQGAKLFSFYYADFGVSALEGGIAANVSWLAANPDTARKFIRATQKAFDMAKANPAGAIDAAIKMRPELARNRDVAIRQLQLSIEAMSTPGTKGFPTGRMSDADWTKMVEQLVASKQIPDSIPLSRLFTNEFVPG